MNKIYLLLDFYDEVIFDIYTDKEEAIDDCDGRVLDTDRQGQYSVAEIPAEENLSKIGYRIFSGEVNNIVFYNSCFTEDAYWLPK